MVFIKMDEEDLAGAATPANEPSRADLLMETNVFTLANQLAAVQQGEGIVTKVATAEEVANLAWWQQGNEEMYTPTNLQARANNRRHPLVMEALDVWWQATLSLIKMSVLDAAERRPRVSKRVYVAIFTKIGLGLLEEGEPPDVAEAREQAQQAWAEDSKGQSDLSSTRFLDALFELCDVWTETTSAQEYAVWLSHLFERIGSKGAGGDSAPGFRDDDDVQQMAASAPALHDDDAHEDAADGAELENAAVEAAAVRERLAELDRRRAAGAVSSEAEMAELARLEGRLTELDDEVVSLGGVSSAAIAAAEAEAATARARAEELRRRQAAGELSDEELAELSALEHQIAELDEWLKHAEGRDRARGRKRGKRGRTSEHSGSDGSDGEGEADSDDGGGVGRRGRKGKRSKRGKKRGGKGGKPSVEHREHRKAGQQQSKAAVAIQAKLRGKKQRVEDQTKFKAAQSIQARTRGRRARRRDEGIDGAPGAEGFYGPGGSVARIDGLNFDIFFGAGDGTAHDADTSECAGCCDNAAPGTPLPSRSAALPSSDEWAVLLEGPDAKRRACYRARLTAKSSSGSGPLVASSMHGATSAALAKSTTDFSPRRLWTAAGYRHSTPQSSGYQPGRPVWSSVLHGDPARFELRRQLAGQPPPLSPMGRLHRRYALHSRRAPAGRWPTAIPEVLQQSHSMPALGHSLSRAAIGAPILVGVRDAAYASSAWPHGRPAFMGPHLRLKPLASRVRSDWQLRF